MYHIGLLCPANGKECCLLGVIKVQDEIFENGEGNRWFERNASVLYAGKYDMVTDMIDMCHLSPKSIMELGCSNGFRLETLREKYDADCYGMDVSSEAISDGEKKFPNIHLTKCSLADAHADRQFDLVVCNFVLHWIDRKNLFTVVRNIDTFVSGGGTLILGDFLPDFNQKRWYHHLKNERVFTYKQDYAGIFKASGIYHEYARVTFNHDSKSRRPEFASSSERAMCVALRKMKTDEYYPEVCEK